MQVTHNDNFDTHAIMGGSDVMTFGIAETAEFFTVLFSSLYSDKPLAVVREVLCNAWDSHIASKNTDKAVEVTVSDTNLVIRDFGFGIPHNKIRDVYLVAGNSTKTNDGKQTGGFGLGSKAPFAYSDHFTVSSYHLGTKILYALSRGSAKTDGKPDARVMVKIPTTESGLEVSIPLKNSEDRREFENLVKLIARNGEMKVNLNGEPIKVLPLSEGKEGFIIHHGEVIRGTSEKIFVRYGSVIYPIPEHKDYANEYKVLLDLIGKLETHDYYRHQSNWKIIFQADPNTIAVTPSRESLSLVETTVDTIKGLLTKLPSVGSTDFMSIASKYITESITKAIADGKQYKMLDMHSLFSKGDNITRNILSREDFIKRMLEYKYPSSSDFQFQDYKQRVKAFAGTNPKNVHVLKAYLKLLNGFTYLEEYYSYHRNDQTKQMSAFTARYITGPLASKMMKSDQVDLKNIFVVDYSNKNTNGKPDYVPLAKAKFYWKTLIELLKNTIIVTQTKQMLQDDLSMNALEDIKNTYGRSSCYLVYLSPRTKGTSEKAVEFFKNLGMNVIDHVAYRASIAPELKADKVEAAPKKPKLVGIPSMSNLVKNGYFACRGHMNENVVRIEKPDFIFQPHNFSGAEYTHKFFEFKDDAGPYIIKLYGDKGGIVVNSRQKDKYIAEGAVDGYIWLGQKLVEEFTNRPALLNQVAFQVGFWKKNDDVGNTVDELYKLSTKSETLRKALGFPDPLTQEEQQILFIWDQVKPIDRYGHRYAKVTSMEDSVKAIEKLITDTVADPLLEVIQSMVKDSKLFGYLDFDSMMRDLNRTTITPEEKDNIESLLLIALQG